MTTRQVLFSPEAEADLLLLYDHIAGEGRERRASASVMLITDYCESFERFPMRGARRDDLEPGVPTIGFERRVTIAFTVSDEVVEILRVLCGGRDLEGAFREDA